MPGTYLALWIGVLIAIALTSELQAGFPNFSYAIGKAVAGAVVGWLLAKTTWPSYWRQKYGK
jgi:membrane associated rhomboid family serine protease